MSLEMAQKVIVPQKKIMSRSFLNSGTLVILCHAPQNPVLKPVYRSISRDQSHTLYHTNKNNQKMGFTIRIGDHYFLKLNVTKFLRLAFPNHIKNVPRGLNIF
jgi:hypothetical protein